MSGNDMRDGTDLASPGAGQRREAYLKEAPRTAERRCIPHLIQMIRRETLRKITTYLDRWSRSYCPPFSSPVVDFDLGQTPPRLAVAHFVHQSRSRHFEFKHRTKTTKKNGPAVCLNTCPSYSRLNAFRSESRH